MQAAGGGGRERGRATQSARRPAACSSATTPFAPLLTRRLPACLVRARSTAGRAEGGRGAAPGGGVEAPSSARRAT